MSDSPEHGTPERRSRGGLALAITIAAVLLLAIFQAIGVVRDHVVLARELTAQQPTVEQGLRLRAQLRTIAGEAAELANSGDVGARNVLAYMRREGFTIKPPQPPPDK